MKKISNSVLALALLGFLSSCGASAALVLNHHATQVTLAANNFQVVDRVSGSAEVEYILLIGGINRKQQYENAYASMLQNAKLQGGARALANVITEEHLGGVPPFYFKRTITVSANVIEFTR